MKKLKMALCFLDEDDTIVAKTILEANWNIDLEEDLKNVYSELKDEVAQLFLDQTKIQLDKGVMKELVNQIFEKFSKLE
jgi:hypothetical protein